MMAPPAVEVITLENFREKMPRWTPSPENHLYALVDMGRFVDFPIQSICFVPPPRVSRCILSALEVLQRGRQWRSLPVSPLPLSLRVYPLLPRCKCSQMVN
jgi:hypothetical protein